MGEGLGNAGAKVGREEVASLKRVFRKILTENVVFKAMKERES